MIKTNNQQNVTITKLPDGYVLNEATGKLIKVGSKKYVELMKQNLVPEPSIGVNIPKKQGPAIVGEATTKAKAIILKKQLQAEQPAPDGMQYSLSNSQNKVLLKQKKSESVKAPAMLDLVSKSIHNVNKKLNGGINIDTDDQEQINLIKQMLAQEMIQLKQKQQPQQQEYECDESDDDE